MILTNELDSNFSLKLQGRPRTLIVGYLVFRDFEIAETSLSLPVSKPNEE